MLDERKSLENSAKDLRKPKPLAEWRPICFSSYGQMVFDRHYNMGSWNPGCDHTCVYPWNTKSASEPEWSPQCAWPGWNQCWKSQRAAKVGRSAVLQVWKAPVWGRHHSNSLQNKFKFYMQESRKTYYSSSEEWFTFLGQHICGNWQIEVYHKLKDLNNKWFQTEIIWGILKKADIEQPQNDYQMSKDF